MDEGSLELPLPGGHPARVDNPRVPSATLPPPPDTSLEAARLALSRDRITDAAVVLIDESGLPRFTMRALGATLGVEAMTLYRYLPSKAELLDAVAGQVLAEVWSEEGVWARSYEGWQDFLQRLARAVRRIALRHPQVFPLVVSRSSHLPWQAPPKQSRAVIDSFLAQMADAGVTEQSLVRAFRAYASFLTGYLLLSLAPPTHEPRSAEQSSLPHGSPDQASDYPPLRRLSAALSHETSAVDFETALQVVMDGIEEWVRRAE